MKKTHLLFALLCSAFVSFGQGNIILFTEAGEAFTAMVNGLKQNATPATNVKLENLPEAAYKVTIIFQDATLGTFTNTVYALNNKERSFSIKLKSESDVSKGFKKVGNNVVRNFGGEEEAMGAKEDRYVLRLISETTLNNAPTSATPTTSNTSVNGTTTQSTTTTTTTTTGGTTAPANGSGNFSMNVSINDEDMGENVNMNVSMSESGTTNSNVNQSYTYTETTTTTSTGGTTTSGSSSNGRCDYPMDNADFLDGKKSIESKTFADSKMTMAKQITKSQCPTSEQIREYTKLFTYETDKLEYAKFAYDYCYDKGNYYKVNDAFGFESTIEELDEYISAR